MAIKTIKASGGDYTTLTAWMASLPVTLTEPEIAEVYSFDLVDSVYLNGVTTTAANYLEVRAAVGSRHTGIAGSGARVRMGSGGVNSPVRIGALHVRLDGIEIYGDKVSNINAVYVQASGAGSDVRVNGCIIHDLATADTTYTVLASLANLNLTFTNNIVYGARRSADFRGCASVLAYNNIYWRSANSLGVLHDSASTVKNNYSGASAAGSEGFWTGGTSPTGSNNVSSDATATIDFPTGSQNNISGASVFTSLVSGSEDFRPLSGSTALFNAGATVASVTVDAIGVARPQGASYDVGAFEFASAGATATTLSGPASGTTGVASTNFTVGANGAITGTVTVTPSDAANGGTFTPTSVAISSGTPTATFTYTPASTGVKTISISDDGALTDATPLSYTSNAAATGHNPNMTASRGALTGLSFYGSRR